MSSFKRPLRSVLMVLLSLSPALANADDPAPKSPEELAIALKRRIGRPGGLTAEQVATRAAATSPDVESARSDVATARAGVNEAAIQFAPRLALSGGYTRLSRITPPVLANFVFAPSVGVGPIPAGTPLANVPVSVITPLDQSTMQAALVVPVSDYLLRIAQNYAANEHYERAATLTERAARLQVRADSKIAYYGWARARLSVTVAEQGLEQVELHLHDARALFDHGAASLADVMQVESQVATNERLVAQARNLERASAEQLKTIMHERGAPAWEIGEDVALILPDDEPTDFDTLAERAARDRLEVRALGESEAAIIKQAAVARATVFPKVEALGEVTHANPNPRFLPLQERFDTTWSVGVKVSWSPNEALTSFERSRQLDAQARKTAARRASVVDGLRTEVSGAIQAWNDAVVGVRTSARGLAASEESYRARRAQFINQSATSTELLDAETDLLRVRLEVINARLDQRVAKVRLEHATGRDVPTSVK